MQPQQKDENQYVIESFIWVPPQFPLEPQALGFPLSPKLSLDRTINQVMQNSSCNMLWIYIADVVDQSKKIIKKLIWRSQNGQGLVNKKQLETHEDKKTVEQM